MEMRFQPLPKSSSLPWYLTRVDPQTRSAAPESTRG